MKELGTHDLCVRQTLFMNAQGVHPYSITVK